MCRSIRPQAQRPQGFGQAWEANPAIHHRLALWADPDQAPNPIGLMQAVNEVFGRPAGDSAPHAVDFPRLARALASLPSALVKRTKVGPVNESRPPIIDSPKSSLEPLAHGVRVNPE